MKKIIFALPLLLCSCTEYNYTIAIEKCNGTKDTVSARAVYVRVDTYKEAVPVMVFIGSKQKNILNVCEYKVLSKKEVIE